MLNYIGFTDNSPAVGQCMCPKRWRVGWIIELTDVELRDPIPNRYCAMIWNGLPRGNHATARAKCRGYGRQLLPENRRRVALLFGQQRNWRGLAKGLGVEIDA